MRSEPLPLIVLTGFLGSGKTSTLGHWLTHTEVPLGRTAVIINDFGSVNVDATLLARRQLELRSITGGCVCCQSIEDLVNQVWLLAQKPDLDLVWIETSGLADPEEVLDHLSTPELHDCTIVRRVVLVIDGTDFPCSWRGRAVQEEQVRYADVILLNKTDQLDTAARGKIEAKLRELNPLATVIATERGQVTPALLSGADHAHEHEHEPHPHEECGCGHAHDEHDHGHEHHHHYPHGAKAHAASTLFLPLPGPVDRRTFRKFLDGLPKSVFRAKGFVRFTESPGQLHTFQQVRDQTELLLLPLENGAEVAPGLVIIGPHLEEAAIRQLAAGLASSPVIS